MQRSGGSLHRFTWTITSRSVGVDTSNLTALLNYVNPTSPFASSLT
jgi:hypothetical protein